MRPERLELRNVTVFRDATVLDLRDVDLFALTGPTGAGKTSIIDAICFALYGAVPRTDGVEPVISLGAGEARIRLDFSIGDRGFTVARVVRRTKTGATTAEARLERDGHVIASGAKDVTASVERLLGLSFDHFTRCVVLPQGEFAAFLHETPAGRQRLLRSLLDLGLFERVRAGARARQQAAEHLVALRQAERAALSDVTEDAIADARDAVVRLDEARIVIERLLPERRALTSERAECERVVRTHEEALRVLASVRRPARLTELTTDTDRLTSELEDLTAEVDRLVDVIETLEKDLAELPDRTELERVRSDRQRRRELAESVVVVEQTVAEAAAAMTDSESRLAEATSEYERSAAVVADLERAHAAHRLAEHLEFGSPCPVCLQIVGRVPELQPLEALESARRSAVEAERRMATRRTAVADTLASKAAAQSRLDGLAAELASLDERLEGLPSDEEAREQLGIRRDLERRLVAERELERAATRRLRTLDRERADLDRLRADIAQASTEVRDALARVGDLPPPCDDLAQAWSDLEAWIGPTRSHRQLARDEAAMKRDDLDARILELDRHLASALDRAAIQGDPSEALSAVVRAHADAQHRVDRLVDDRRRAEELDDGIATACEAAAVAKQLAAHLSARGFEPWLMQEAMMALVIGANALLDELAGGAYSLQVVDGAFSVVDHRNADELRSAKTLSGGETFLVALALALSLAEHVRTVAGGAVIESVFIDEGFGSLDAASLDVVASVLHRLGERDQMVGVVTHVVELAHQIPVRFEVSRSHDGSRVERVET